MNVPEPAPLNPGEPRQRPQETGKMRTTTHAHTGSAVAQKLRTAILAGTLRPGVKLSERTLGDELGVSRNTLREAFTVLGAERIITRIPNRGVFVARPSCSDVEEMYRIRRVLEPAALRQDAHGAARPALQNALEQAVDRGLAARASHDVPGMAQANQEFHALVVALARSPRLDTMMAHVQAEMRLVFHVLAGDPAFHAPFSVSNAHIFARWKAGHCEEAAAEMDGYLQQAQAQVLAAMPVESGGLP